MKPFHVVLRGRGPTGHFIDQTVFVVAQNSMDALKQGNALIPEFKAIQAQEAKREVFDAWASKIKKDYSRVMDLEAMLKIGQ